MPKLDASFDPAAYALVAERIALFYQRFPLGRIITRLVSRSEHEVTFRALVFRSPDEHRPAATGWASEREGDGDINRVACLENTETSAIGRALANLGFTASRRRPSREEMEKAMRAREPREGALRAVREAAPLRAPELQQRADLVADALSMLAAAERGGLSPSRSRTLRVRLLRDDVSERRVERVERRLRDWVERRVGVWPRHGALPDS